MMVAPAHVCPDRFVVVSVIKPDTGVRTKFIVAGFHGGYLHGDSWRVSRDVVKVTDEGDYWMMETRTGSVYQLYKGRYGTTGMTAGIIEDMKRGAEKAPEMGWQIEEEYN